MLQRTCTPRTPYLVQAPGTLSPQDYHTHHSPTYCTRVCITGMTTHLVLRVQCISIVIKFTVQQQQHVLNLTPLSPHLLINAMQLPNLETVPLRTTARNHESLHMSIHVHKHARICVQYARSCMYMYVHTLTSYKYHVRL